jgi:hypothetical protein
MNLGSALNHFSLITPGVNKAFRHIGVLILIDEGPLPNGQQSFIGEDSSVWS